MTLTTSGEYAGLSRRHADGGDLRMAQLAAWAGDVHVLEELLWQNGLSQAPDPTAALGAVGENVAASVEAVAATLPAHARLTARQVVEAAREALVTTFDASVHGLLTDRFDDLAHLDDCPPDGAPDRAARTAARLGDLSAAELAAELRTAAADCMAMAELLFAGEEHDAGHRLARQSDAAAFEAHLVSAAVRAGDGALVTVDLRWGLVADEDPRPDRLAAVVGSAERDALLRTLEPAAAP